MDNEGIGNGSANPEVQPVECDSMYYDTTDDDKWAESLRLSGNFEEKLIFLISGI